MVKLSFVVPVFNSAKTLNELIERLEAVGRVFDPFEVVLVNDGSADNSAEVAAAIARERRHVKFISFFKNFGQTGAICAGLKEAKGEAIVVLDDDLQNPPEEVPKLLNELERGRDFAFGTPEVMQQSWARIKASRMMAAIGSVLLRKPAHIYPSSFFALRASLARELLKYEGPYPYISGLIFRVSLNGSSVLVRQAARKEGGSHYSLGRLIRLALNGMTNFSIVPLRVASIIGIGMSAVGFLVLLVLLVKKVFLGGFLTGWTSTLGAIILFSGLQLLALGILGEYVGRIFMVLNKTPQYSIRERINCD